MTINNLYICFKKIIWIDLYNYTNCIICPYYFDFVTLFINYCISCQFVLEFYSNSYIRNIAFCIL